MNLYRHLTFRLIAPLLLGLVFSSSASAWWDGDWTLRKKITIDLSAKGAGITEPLGPAVVLIRLHDGDFQFSAAKEDGTDLRFIAADDKTLLTYHIEKFDPLLNEAFIWVKVPDLKSGAQTTFWLYYGNQGPKATSVINNKGTYDPDTVLVYHFTEHGQPAMDFSGNGNTAKNPGTTVDGSIIGSGLRLGAANTLTVLDSPSLAWPAGGSMTFSAWIKPAALASNATLFTRKDGANSFVVGLDNGIPFVEVSASGSSRRTPAGAALSIGSWRHLEVTAAGSTITLQLDGETYATLAASLPALHSPLVVGRSSEEGAADNGFAGEVDELHLSRVSRPAALLKFEALSQGGEKAAQVVALSPDEQPSSFFSWLGSGTFGVIIKSLTVDGWVIICILMIMAVLSWFVMFNKVSYLNGISKGNALFMKEWKRVSEDLTVLDSGDPDSFQTMGGHVDQAAHRAMRNASVYRIYHIGVTEVRHRIVADNAREGTRRGLAGRSIQAIRASLDGGLIRETQKINKLIVLLTICISGGPFLGLLGTVVGVMITFAAVAAAGEVNVNAIAPGIAAALLATVAGLAVAIPSLFGYNYILSRVKDAKDDMHIFIDEFVTKMAEFYKESPPEYLPPREHSPQRELMPLL